MVLNQGKSVLSSEKLADFFTSSSHHEIFFSTKDGSSHKAKQNHLKSVISLFFTKKFPLKTCYMAPGAASTELNGFAVLYFRDAN